MAKHAKTTSASLAPATPTAAPTRSVNKPNAKPPNASSRATAKTARSAKTNAASNAPKTHSARKTNFASSEPVKQPIVAHSQTAREDKSAEGTNV